jgi:hypothetical protein
VGEEHVLWGLGTTPLNPQLRFHVATLKTLWVAFEMDRGQVAREGHVSADLFLVCRPMPGVPGKQAGGTFRFALWHRILQIEEENWMLKGLKGCKWHFATTPAELEEWSSPCPSKPPPSKAAF